MNENQPSTGTNHLQQPHAPAKTVPQAYRMKKTWLTATTRSGHVTQKRVNSTIEACYHRILKNVKALLAQHTQTVFEKNQKRDNSEDCFAMHSFIGQSFYFKLECNISCDYRVEYAFYDCPFEDEIRSMLRTYPLDELDKEVRLKPTFTQFYNNVLAFQDSKHSYLLKV